jgi:hypothetical protein
MDYFFTLREVYRIISNAGPPVAQVFGYAE